MTARETTARPAAGGSDHVVSRKHATVVTTKPLKAPGAVAWDRRELKYVVGESLSAAVEQYIQPYVTLDPYSAVQDTRAYPILTLYLDSPDFVLCRQSLTGEKNRFKLRLRSYTEDDAYPRYLEIKRRMDGNVIKGRVPLRAEELVRLMSRGDVPETLGTAAEETVRQFGLYAGALGAGPVMRVRYLRRAYRGRENHDLRITFDRQICYQVERNLNLSLNGDGWRRMAVGGVVLEIKFTHAYPAWLSRMVAAFDLRRQSMSKYAKSVQQSCLLGFCAPAVRES